MRWLSSESALAALVATAAVAWFVAMFCRAQIEPWERSSSWEAWRKIASFVMWAAVGWGALSLLLNAIRFAKA